MLTIIITVNNKNVIHTKLKQNKYKHKLCTFIIHVFTCYGTSTVMSTMGTGSG